MCGNKRLSSCAVVGAATLLANGFTSMRVAASAPGVLLPGDFVVGNRVRGRARDESSIQLRVAATGLDNVEGRRSGGIVRIPFRDLRDLRDMRERRFAPGRTVGVLYLAHAAATVSLLNAAAGGL
jgi:hypothetical protein